MKTTLKIIGYIFVFIAIVGGGQVIVREGLNIYTFGSFMIYLLIAGLCFWGSKKKSE